MDDTASTLLDEIREGQRQALGEIDFDDLAPDCVTQLVTTDVPRLLAALDGVLKAAADWQRYAADGDAQDACAREIRKVVARELVSSTTSRSAPDVPDEAEARGGEVVREAADIAWDRTHPNPYRTWVNGEPPASDAS